MTRKLSARELNHLIRFGYEPEHVAGEIPVEYITGFAEFAGHIFMVNQHTLIPRIETEHLITLALEQVKTKDKVTFADIGTGCGAIGITFALQLLALGVDFGGFLSDISNQAIFVAEDNWQRLSRSADREKVTIFSSDLLQDFPESVSFDLIFANLPYIPTHRLGKLASSVKDFEPELALDGGIDGLKLINRLIKQAKGKLNRGGVLLLEVDDTHIKPHPGFSLIKDLAGKPRFWFYKSE